MSGQPEQPLQQRQIRVFISSTFRDMHAEREELVKQVFPQLRKLCEQRGVVWSDVDLRWGVTDEQKAEGHALPICLAEIERCRPYFIGLLGERYGPPVEKIHPDVLAREPWLNDHLDHSLTEMEILHGVLRNPAMAEHAFFYFRDAAYLDRLPDGANPADFRSENADQAERLHQLKARIRTSGFPVKENYADPKALGQLVLADFTTLIDRLYPEGSRPSPLDREAMDQDFYAASRKRAYIRRQADFDALDRHAAGQGEPLVVLGESGVGKSALLANWTLEYRKRHPEELVLLHFIGATPYSSDWAAMARRIMGEFERRLGVQEKNPDEPEALRLAFANALYKAAAKKRVVLVLDGLDRLEDREGAPDLVWLPPEVPANVRVVVSTLPGRPLEEAQRRRWQMLTVHPLARDDRHLLIRDYLFQYAKELKPQQMARIAAAEQTANPLYLRTLLEELRLFGEHDGLEGRLVFYLTAPTVPALYEKILTRYEEDYEQDRPGLVRDALTMLWSARRGLSERELLEVLRSTDESLPVATWSPLFLAIEFSLVNRSGLISISHSYLRDAVRAKYVSLEPQQQASHLRLARYFEGSGVGPRKLEELPWQLARAGSWHRLYNLLGDLTFFEAAWEANEYDVKSFWAGIESNSPWRLLDCYAAILAEPLLNVSHVWSLARLLNDTGHPRDAQSLFHFLTDRYRYANNVAGLAMCLGAEANILASTGHLNQALLLYRDQESLCRTLGDRNGMQISLGNQGTMLYLQGDPDAALILQKQAESICLALGNADGLARSKHNQALILKLKGDISGAKTLLKDVEAVWRRLGNKSELQAVYCNEAGLLSVTGHTDEAMALYVDQEKVCRELGDKTGLALALGGQADVLSSTGDINGAMRLHKQAEHICRNLDDKSSLETCLHNQAHLLKGHGDWDGAINLLREAEQICRELNKKASLQSCLGNQADILYLRGNLPSALALYKEQERICRELENRKGLQSAIGGQALTLKMTGDLKGAIDLHLEEERICIELGYKLGLQRSLGNQAVIHKSRGQLDEALRLLKRQESICREINNPDGVQRSIGNQANILYSQGDPGGALALYKVQEEICRTLDNKDDLGASLNNQAVLRLDRGDLEGATTLLKEYECICRTLKNKYGLAMCLGNRALILEAQSDLSGAVQRQTEAEALFRELGNPDGICRSLCNRALLLSRQAKIGKALLLVEKAHEIAAESELTGLLEQVRTLRDSFRARISGG